MKVEIRLEEGEREKEEKCFPSVSYRFLLALTSFTSHSDSRFSLAFSSMYFHYTIEMTSFYCCFRSFDNMLLYGWMQKGQRFSFFLSCFSFAAFCFLSFGHCRRQCSSDFLLLHFLHLSSSCVYRYCSLPFGFRLQSERKIKCMKSCRKISMSGRRIFSSPFRFDLFRFKWKLAVVKFIQLEITGKKNEKLFPIDEIQLLISRAHIPSSNLCKEI